MRTGVTEGHFLEDTDPAQVAHELYGVMLGHHFAARLMRDPAAAARANTAFEHLLDRIRT